MKKVFIYLTALFLGAGYVHAQVVDTTLWQVIGGSVNTMLKDEGTLYIGGSFTSVSVNTGCFSGIDPVNARTVFNKFQLPAGVINVIIPDGQGGWFVGGDFAFVKGGKTFNDLAHVNASGELDMNFAFTTSANGFIKALHMKNNRLYVGGKFTTIGAQSRTNIAEIDISSAQITIWNPGANNDVNAITSKESLLYIAGTFTSLNGQACSRIGCIDLSSGVTTSFKPNVSDGAINTMQVIDQKLYIGGSFSTIDGIPRGRIASFNLTSDTLENWSPVANGAVNVIAQDATKFYVGGDFTSIGGFSYNRLVAFDKTSGEVLPWVPNPNGSVYSIFVSGNMVYAAGAFSNIGGQDRNRAARIAPNGAVDSWTPYFNNTVRSILVSDGKVLAGGNFTSSVEIQRNRLASINLSTGEPTEWNPNANNSVNVMVLYRDTIYVGGSFTNVGAKTSNYLAGLQKQSGANIGWNPAAADQVREIVIHNDKLYVGGNFGSIAGKARYKFAEFVPATRSLTNLDIGVQTTSSRYVSSIIIKDSILYVGGYFSQIKGQTRNNLAKLNLSNNTLSSWNPNVNNIINIMSLQDTLLYVGGQFSSVSGLTRNRLAAISTNSGVPTGWNPNMNNTVSCLNISGSNMYAGGSFATVGGVSRPYLASISLSGTGELNTWSVSLNNAVNALLVTSNCSNEKLYLGGSFTSIAGYIRSGLSAVSGMNQVLISPSITNVSCGGLSDGSVTITINGGSSPFTYSKDNSNFQSGNTITGLNAGNHTIYIKDANGCVLESYVNITEPAPIQVSATIIAENCAGEKDGSISLDVSGGTGPYTYVWTGVSGSGSSVNNISGGDYSVKVTDSKNCDKTESYHVDSKPLPVAAFDFEINNGLVSFTNKSSGGVLTYSWTFDDNSTSTDENPNHTYSASGTYNVCLSATNDCGENNLCKSVSVTIAGINTLQLVNQVKLFPNPAENFVQIDTENSAILNHCSYSIFDLFGRIVLSGYLDKNNMNIGIESLDAGIYMLTIGSETIQMSMPLVKK